ncbi:MAG: HEAT repeat domain-containing protein [Planctomycetes bacterium]|nr:HEAT repeat domain-containing protein [Planctomycetota bacterium]
MMRRAAAFLLALLVAATLPAQGGGGKGGNRPAAGAPEAPAGAPAKGGEAGKAKDTPPPPPADPEVVKAALKEFQATWTKASLPQKVAAIEKLAAVGGEDVAATLAAKLTDNDPTVRGAIAQALGRLQQPKTVTPLGAALQREIAIKEPALPTVQALCTALGAIGDSKAVGPLTEGVFAGNDEAENFNAIVEARLNAVGQIKDKASVDALIDLFGKVPSAGGGRSATGGRGGRSAGNARVQRLVTNPLRKLTRQNHEDADAWRGWWKDARAKFVFP